MNETLFVPLFTPICVSPLNAVRYRSKVFTLEPFITALMILSSVPLEMRDKLRKWREDNCRNSEQIVDVGEELISEHSSKLGDDSKWFSFSQLPNSHPFMFQPKISAYSCHHRYYVLNFTISIYLSIPLRE